MKKIIVTAPTSAVASNFIQYAKNRYEIVTLGRRESHIIFDFFKDEDLLLPSNIDTIIHFAGMMHANTDREILEMISTNINGLMKLCIAAKQSCVKQIIYISSINATLFETSKYFGYYSLTKRQAEETAKLYCKNSQIRLCILRPSQIFGDDNIYSKTQPLLYMMIKNAVQNKPITIYGTKDVLRNYIYADNLFQIIEKSIGLCSDDEIDVIDSKNYRLSEVADIIIHTFHSGSEIQFLRDKADMADNSFSMRNDYFKKWNIPFIGLKQAMERISGKFL